jgi:hypothetical protein
VSEYLKKILHNDGLEITFLVEDGVARVEYRASGDYDLTDTDDVILFVNGDNIAVKATDPAYACGVIGPWEEFAKGPVNMTTRVGEFFDGWEFEP